MADRETFFQMFTRMHGRKFGTAERVTFDLREIAEWCDREIGAIHERLDRIAPPTGPATVDLGLSRVPTEMPADAGSKANHTVVGECVVQRLWDGEHFYSRVQPRNARDAADHRLSTELAGRLQP